MNKVEGNIQVDELEIFDRALTDAEFEGLFMANEGGKCRPEIDDRPIVATCSTDPSAGTPLSVGDSLQITANGLPQGAVIDYDFDEEQYLGVTSQAQSHTFATSGGYGTGFTWTYMDQTGFVSCRGFEVVPTADLACANLVPLDGGNWAVGETVIFQMDPLTVGDWTFHDGTEDVSTDTTTFTYGQAGQYSVFFTTADERVECTVEIDEGLPPECKVSPTSVKVGETVQATLFDAAGDPIVASWNMGDGTALPNTVLVNHEYQAANTYTIIAITSDGQRITCEEQVTVDEDAPPVVLSSQCSIGDNPNPGSAG